MFWKGSQAIFTRSKKFWKFALNTEFDSFIELANWLHWTLIKFSLLVVSSLAFDLWSQRDKHIPLFFDCRDRLFFFRLACWFSIVPGIVDTNNRFVKRLLKFQMPILILLHQFFRKRDVTVLIRLSTSFVSIFPLSFQ